MAINGRGDFPLNSSWNRSPLQFRKSFVPGSDQALLEIFTDWMFEQVISTLSAEPGAFTETGTAATLKYDRRLNAESGTFTETGANATLQYVSSSDIVMSAESGSFAVTGSDVALTPGISLTTESGSFAITGTDASLEAHRRIVAAAGTYAITGTDASLEDHRSIPADKGSFAVTGSPVLFHRLYLDDLSSDANLGATMDAEFMYPTIRRKIPYKAKGRRLSIRIRCNEPGRWMKLYDLSAIMLPLVGWSRSDAIKVKGTGRHLSVKFSCPGGKQMRLAYTGMEIERLVGWTRSDGEQLKGTGNHLAVRFSNPGGKPMKLAYSGLQIERYPAR